MSKYDMGKEVQRLSSCVESLERRIEALETGLGSTSGDREPLSNRGVSIRYLGSRYRLSFGAVVIGAPGGRYHNVVTTNGSIGPGEWGTLTPREIFPFAEGTVIFLNMGVNRGGSYTIILNPSNDSRPFYHRSTGQHIANSVNTRMNYQSGTSVRFDDDITISQALRNNDWGPYNDYMNRHGGTVGMGRGLRLDLKDGNQEWGYVAVIDENGTYAVDLVY